MKSPHVAPADFFIKFASHRASSIPPIDDGKNGQTHEDVTPHREVQEIFGKDFWGPNVFSEVFEYSLREEPALPLPGVLAKFVARTHRVIYIPEISIMSMVENHPDLFGFRNGDTSSVAAPFGKDPGQARWWFMPKNQATIEALDNPLRGATVREAVYVILLWKRKIDRWLLDSDFTFPCEDKTRDDQITVGKGIGNMGICFWPTLIRTA